MEMASETGFSDQSSPTNSTYSAMPPFLPFMLGFTSTNLRQNSTNPIQETQDQANHGESRDRIIFINPVTQTTFVMETSGGSMGWDSLFGDLFAGKSCQRPASKAFIDALPSVEIVDGENGDEQCVVCLEEWEAGEMAKEMPCKHRFHADCIEKWLRINACCPVCRYQMPVDEDEDAGRKTREENGGERRRGIWVRFDFGGGWRNREIFQTSSDESRENGDSSSNHQSNHEIRQNIDSSSNHQETED